MRVTEDTKVIELERELAQLGAELVVGLREGGFGAAVWIEGGFGIGQSPRMAMAIDEAIEDARKQAAAHLASGGRP